MLLLVLNYIQPWAVNNDPPNTLPTPGPTISSASLLLKSMTFSYLGHHENDPHFTQIYTTLKNNYKSQKIYLCGHKKCV